MLIRTSGSCSACWVMWVITTVVMPLNPGCANDRSPAKQPLFKLQNLSLYDQLRLNWIDRIGKLPEPDSEGGQHAKAFEEISSTVSAKDLIPLATDIQFDEFDSLLRQRIVGMAISEGDEDVIDSVLARAFVDRIDGEYVEYALEVKTGKSVEILRWLFMNGSSQTQVVGAFRRAFPSLWDARLPERDFVDNCYRYYESNKNAIAVNGKYIRPQSLAPSGDEPEPQVQGLFVKK